MSDLNINWKDGVGEVTDQPLTVSPGSGAGDAPVSLGSVMNKGLDRTVELEVTTQKGVKRTLTVNQEGCRQAYVTSDGKRWRTSDNRVYGVLKSDAPCECLEVTPNVIKFKIDDADPDPLIESCGDSSWIKGRRCLVKKTDTGVAICYLDENNSELFHDGVTPASLDGSMGQWMTDIPSYRYSHKGGEYDVSNIQNLVHEITLTHNDSDDNITEWGNAGLFRRCLVGVTKAINIDGKLWSKKGVRSTGSLTPVVFHDYAIALGDGFDIIDYETHCKIAHLFYAKYANRNSQKMSQFGYGSTSYPRVSGTTFSLGNNDGKTSTQISFLGIEDFYGNMSEWVGGIHSNNSVYYIYDGFEINTVPTSGYRTIDIGGSSRYGYINKVYWGEHGDMIPIEIGASSTTNYCDYSWIARKNWNIACRSSSGGGDNGGVAFFNSSYSNNMSESSRGSRIQYRGPIQVIEDPVEFIAMPDGFNPPSPTNYFVLYDYSDDSSMGLNKTFTVKKPYDEYEHIGVEEFIYEFGWHVEDNSDGYNIPGVGGLDNPMMPGIASGMVHRGQSGGFYAVNDGFTLYLDTSSGSVKLFVGAFSYNSNELQPVSIGLPGGDGTIKISFKKTSKMSGTLKVYVNDVEKNVSFMPYSGDGYEDLAGLTDNQVTMLGTDKRHFTSFKHSIRTYEEHIPIN